MTQPVSGIANNHKVPVVKRDWSKVLNGLMITAGILTVSVLLAGIRSCIETSNARWEREAQEYADQKYQAHLKKARDHYSLCVGAMSEAQCKLKIYEQYNIRFTD